jgi:hypothetical protein
LLRYYQYSGQFSVVAGREEERFLSFPAQRKCPAPAASSTLLKALQERQLE